jgi:uroporphyrinogen-III synthase
MTGIGTRLLVRLVEPVFGRTAFIHALAATRIVARGPKPMTALRELDVSPWLTVPTPNTWRQLLTTLDTKDAGVCAGGTRVAVQEYGMANPELIAELERRGAVVTTVPIYRWALPDDIAPLRAAVRSILRGEIDVMILTAGVQLVHLLQVAAGMRLESAVRCELGRIVIASIGPMTSDELRRQRLQIDLEPSHPKMGFLVKEVAERCGDLLRDKRRVQS